MGEPRLLVPKTPFRFQSMGAGSSVGFPVGSPVDVTGCAGGELAVMFYDRHGTTWNSDATLSVGISNALWSPDAPTMLATENNVTPARVTIRGDTPELTLLRCGLSEYAALGAMVQAYVIAEAGGSLGDISATMSVLIDCSGRQPVAPYLMAGLTAWYRADRCTENQTEVESIQDLSGNGRDLVGADAVYVPAALNGQPGILFNGSVMASQSTMPLSTFSIFSVFRSSTAGIVYEHSPLTNSTEGCYLYGTTTATIAVRRSAAMNSKNRASNWAGDNVDRIVRHSCDGTSAGHTLALRDPLT